MFYTNVQPHGNYIALRGVNDRGESFKEKLNYEPTLFVESHKPQNPQWKSVAYRRLWSSSNRGFGYHKISKGRLAW